MIIVKKIKDLKKLIKEKKSNEKKIGLVPTMGYLHRGHISLIEKSVKENEFTIVSVFVNPTQFGENEDFDKYPRDIEKDSEIAKTNKVDILFIPDAYEIYPQGFNTTVEVKNITGKLCGKSRPKHFAGVATIVNKLFNIIEADNAYFGQKDYQQYFVIKKMVIDLNMNINLVMCPIIREEDGLAMSSRNVYLSESERKSSLSINESLEKARIIIESGECDKNKVLKIIENNIKNKGLCELDYVEILNADNLDDISIIKGKILIAVAVFYGKTRLIDNVVLEVV